MFYSFNHNVSQGCEKPHIFYRKGLLTKNEGAFLPRAEMDYPLICIN
ncbi:hypothetical protein HMPREF0201_02457 [Cedecea davisae DSM 4568]|uniref:Uncharacterized protein n=1 Tax=Cedecea davisae DSM 4568 TaxID=566551 RepID=S3JUB1_9ENTR|nr:hypothetical protein HMPREF0201_02457 [Cedecea davisae DSM 4568]